MDIQFRKLSVICVVCCLVPTVFLSLTVKSNNDIYPSSTDFKPESVLSEEAWLLFLSVDGFNRTPSATGHDGTPISIRLDDLLGFQHSVFLNQRTNLGSEYITEVKVSYVTLDDTDMEILNVTASVRYFELEFAEYYLTAFIDSANNTHIFWERIHDWGDAPKRYWLFHEIISKKNGTTIESEMFYFEIKELETNPPYDAPIWLIFPILAVVVAVAVISWTIYRRNKEVS